jgi:hypothetical protein
MVKAGKGILQIKRELEEKEKKEREKEKVFVLPKVETKVFVKKRSRIWFLKPLSVLFAIIFIVYFANAKFNFQKSISYFLATMTKNFEKLVQAPTRVETEKETFEFPETEPYLTINAETAIKGSLDVRDTVTSPSFVIKRGTYNATLATAPLTADRTYTFPDQSGIVCLSTGNCVGLAGEVLSPGGTVNRLAKFIGGRRIGDSSIQDLFSGILITISSGGNVGIGIENPLYPLHVRGRIQATGDICTDLGGGKCLSQLAPPSPPLVLGGGVGGSGTPNFIPIWTGATTLGNSILSQSGSTITLAGNMSIVGLLTTSGLKISTTTIPGYILVAADTEGNIIFAPPPTGTIPSGTKLLRASLPIFKYPNPAQTATTSFVNVSIKVSTSSLAEVLPPQIPGSQRKFALLLKFADNIPETASSTFRIDFDTLSDLDFEFQGQNLTSLETGILHLKDELLNLANDNWILKAKVPSSSYTLRIFNIFLLCYDETL